MKKLLNTLYLTQEDFYVTKEGDNIVIKQEGKVLKRFPFRIIDGIVCFFLFGCVVCFGEVMYGESD
ncbi:DNA polymerase [Streptococcus pyogenes]|nr:DNA polymerase [Streptococcus pyogenes]